MTEMARNSMATEAPYSPVTVDRKVRTDLEVSLPKPCMSSLPLLCLISALSESFSASFYTAHQLFFECPQKSQKKHSCNL